MLYVSRPRDFNPQFSTVACEVTVDGEVLLLRCAIGKKFAGFLGLPGGKTESGESSHIAIAREAYEETGIDKRDNPNAFKYVGTRWVRFRNIGDFVYQHFSLSLPEKPNIALSKREHSESLWVPTRHLDRYKEQMIEDVFETLQAKTWEQH